MLRLLLLASCCTYTCALALTPVVEVDVNVVVLRLPNLEPSSAAPYWDASASTLPIDADGDVTLMGEDAGSTMATSLAESDVVEIFDEVNRFFNPTNVKFNPSVSFVGPTTSECEEQGGLAAIEGKYKTRTHDYLVKHFGSLTKDGNNAELVINLANLVPRSAFVPGKFNVLYVKYIGIGLQGFVSRTSDWQHASEPEMDTWVATIGQWSNKHTDAPVMRPNVLECGGDAPWEGVTDCGIGLAYTTAHELGHLIGLGHTDPPSIMKSGGASAADSAFSMAHVAAIQAHFASSGAATSPWHPTLWSYSTVLQTFEAEATALGMEPLAGVTPGTVVCSPPSPPSPPPSPPPAPPPWRGDWTGFTSLYKSGSKSFDTTGGCGLSYLTGLHVIYDREGDGDIDRYNFELLCADGTKDYIGPYDVSKDAADWADPTSESTVECTGTANYVTGMWGDRWRKESGDYDYFEFGLYCADGSFQQTTLGHSGSTRSDGSAKCEQTSGDVPAAVTDVNVVKYRKSSGDWDFYDFRVKCGAPPTVLLTYQTCSLATSKWAESKGPIYVSTSDSERQVALPIPSAGQAASVDLVSFTGELTFSTEQADGWCVQDVKVNGNALLGPDGNVPTTVWIDGPAGATNEEYTWHAQA